MAELKSKKITVDGRKLVVHEATTLLGINRDLAMMKAAEEKYENDTMATVASVVYPSVAGCTTGEEIPSLDEYLNMSEVEATKWTRAAQKMNPHWLSFNGLLSKEKQDQKKVK